MGKKKRREGNIVDTMVFNSREEFELEENTTAYDLYVLGNYGDFDLDLKRKHDISYGRGYYFKNYETLLFFDDYRLVANNVEKDRNIKEFLVEIICRGYVEKKEKE